ncbi:pyruvate, phosphate dikinase [Candidatus Gracilibacteria bacterium]|nr:pyruvate, phosphate dikinase [Candidatus Gracilibacteria bacterium]
MNSFAKHNSSHLQYVYSFLEGDSSQKALLGGKGANLAEMTRLGIPVPPGFTVTTETCNAFLANDKKFPDTMWNEVLKHMKELEKKLGKQFGDLKDPLLVSVRSGAAISMPGMMDTILNLGLNDQTVQGLAKSTQNERFAYDSYRRFIQMFSNVVLGLEGKLFEEVISHMKKSHKKTEDTELTADDWKKVIEQFKKIVETETGSTFPQDPEKQLERAIRAVFESWLNPRAITYRKINHISDTLGTAVNVQAMVFGNKGEKSGTGVAFTRNPSTGEKKLFGEFLINAQGEDVVAGIRTPQDISELQKVMPEIFLQFREIAEKLENHFRDMQDLEFTIEQGKLFLLQTRNGKRSAAADLNTAIDMVEEGLISKKEAVLRISPNSLDKLLHPQIAPGIKKQVIAKGLPASPGAAVGKIVFTADHAEALAKKGEKVILVRHETSPEDIHGMFASEGIVTSCGGMTSHAAVVARGMGKPCVAGASKIAISEKDKTATVGNIVLHEGDALTLDGSNGEVILGTCETRQPELSGNFKKILDWADELCPTFKVRTNADTPADSAKAREFGAVGIGLCRTEHMFFDENRIAAMREMILSQTEPQREKALAKLLPYQKKDFIGIFTAMDGFPVTVRLLDPPLHEFLPQKEEDIRALAKELGLSFEEVRHHVTSLHESNPMLGHRGCRLMITYPEVAKMQTRAIMEAACECHQKGIKAIPEIMVPLVGATTELSFLRKLIEGVIQEVFEEYKMNFSVLIGTMIEIPRACLIADKIAKYADFFSFGTNDLTQMTFGYSRDDAGKFLPSYVSDGFLPHDPFQVLDQEGIGQLITLGVEKARSVKPDLKIGICGEHGGEPSSIDFCFHQDFNYVSCSPFRVPVARIAAAQSYLKKWGEK